MEKTLNTSRDKDFNVEGGEKDDPEVIMLV
jgi:hypothetical protein